jgi:hypothetical protein
MPLWMGIAMVVGVTGVAALGLLVISRALPALGREYLLVGSGSGLGMAERRPRPGLACSIRATTS